MEHQERTDTFKQLTNVLLDNKIITSIVRSKYCIHTDT
jgi:hypothetical protein